MQILRTSGILVILLLAAYVQGKLYHASKANNVDLSATSSWTLYPGLDLTKTFSKPQTVFVFYQITGANYAQFLSMLRINGDQVSTSTTANEYARNLVGFWTKVVPPGTYRFQVFYKCTASLRSSDTDWTSNIIQVFWMDYLETTSASSHLTCEQQLNTDNFWRSLDSTTTTLLVPEQRAVLAFYTSSFAFPSTVSGEMFTQLEVDGFPDGNSTCSKGLITQTHLICWICWNDEGWSTPVPTSYKSIPRHGDPLLWDTFRTEPCCCSSPTRMRSGQSVPKIIIHSDHK